jgi:parallel beta-helix repeat protein
MHKNNAIVSIITLFLLISTLIVSLNSEKTRASGQDIYVDDDQRYPDEADGSLYNPFKTIQDAVDIAQNGDTIKILKGIYSGDITIDKSITIKTESVVDVFINSTRKDAYLIDVLADSVSLEGLYITDATTTSHRKAVIHISSQASDVKIIDSHIDYSKNGYGILIENAHGAVIRNNTVNNTRGIYIGDSNLITLDYNKIMNCSKDSAVRISNSIGNQVVNNYIDNSTNGIYTSQCTDSLIDNNVIGFNFINGIYIFSGNGNEITNNIIKSNFNYGIDLGGNYNTVQANKIIKNTMGISIGGSDCIIKENEILYSLHTGIYTRPGSKNNIIYDNYFKYNVNMNAKEEGNNKWDDGYIGNWWDDFYGPNPNNMNNTVVYDYLNVPDIYKYEKNGVCDNYPLGIYQKQPTISNPSPANEESGVDRSPVLSVKVTDPEPPLYKEEMDIYFYYILNNTYNLIGVNSDIESGGIASMPFSSIIKGKHATYSYKGLGYDYIGVWYVEVEDSFSRTKSPIWVFSTINTPLDNKKPVLDITVSNKYLADDKFYAQINDTIQFDASSSYDPDGEIIFYKWTFPPDTSIINEISPTHSFKNEGKYVVNLVVIDNDGSSNSLNTTVIIQSKSNRPPVAVLNGNFVGSIGKPITFDGSGSYDPDSGDTIVTNWDFGDGDNGSGMVLNHIYEESGNYTITLTVTDMEGESDSSVTYALIKVEKKEESPAFEIVLIFISMLFILIFKKRTKK